MTTIFKVTLVFLGGIALWAAPPNDNFANAPVPAGTSFVTNGTFFDATVEHGEPLPVAALGGTVWYTFVPSESGSYLIGAGLSQTWLPFPAVRAYRGESVSNLTAIPNNFTADPSPSSRFTLRAAAGETIRLQVINRSNAGSLQFVVQPAPSNDDFANALLITNVVTSGTTRGASSEEGDVGNQTVWYKWQPERSTGYEITLTTFSPSHALYLCEGNSLGNLTVISKIETSPYSQRQATTNVYASSSKTYYIAVSGPGPYSDDFEFRIVGRMGNDGFSERLPINADATVFADTTRATREPGEPWHNGTNWQQTLWYEWTAPETGGFYIEYQSSHQSWYPFPGFEIYQGSALSNLTVVRSRPFAFGWPETRSGIAFRAVAGEKYAIAHHDYLQRTNQFILKKGAVHDEFENALEINHGTNVHFSAPAATVQPGEDALHESSISVWHRFTAPSNGTYVAIANGGYPKVYRGNSLSELQLAEPSAELIQYQAYPFRASAGETLYVAILDTGGYDLRLDVAAANDDFVNRTAITGDGMVSSNGWATIEPGEPLHTTNFLAGSLWWKWTPTNPVPHRILARAGHHAGVLSLYKGEQLTNLTFLASGESINYAGMGFSFAPEAGVEYAICLSYVPTWDNPVALEIYTPPAHDDFSDAIPILTDFPVTNTVGIATMEPGETWSTNRGTIWYSWIAPATGSFAFLPSTSAWGIDLHVFSGSELASLQLLESLYGAGGSSGISFHAQAGMAYYIAVALPAFFFPVVLSPTIVPGPTNDDFENRTRLSGLYAGWEGTTLGATSEPGEAVSAESYDSASVWAEWSAPVSGNFRAMIDPPGLNVDFLAGDAFAGAQSSGVNRNNGIEFEAKEGVSYLIRVAASPYRMSEFTLRLGPVATNDAPTRPIELSGTNISRSIAFWTVPQSFSGQQTRLWYQWTAPAFGMLDYSLVTNDATASIRIFHLKRPTVSSNIVYHAERPWLYVRGTFAVTKDVTYLIGIHSGVTTNLTLNLEFQDAGEDLGSYSDILVGGSATAFPQTNTVFSPPEALQLGPVAPLQNVWIERVFRGRGYLRYRLAGEGSPFSVIAEVSPYHSYGGTLYSRSTFPWEEHMLELQSETNVVRWRLQNGSTTSDATLWFDEFVFVPAVPSKPHLRILTRPSSIEVDVLTEATRITTIEVSTNLVQWSPWTNVTRPGTMRVPFTVPNSPGQAPRFYRARAR